MKKIGFNVKRFADMDLYVSAREIDDYRIENNNLLPLLYQTGYLTIESYDWQQNRYRLRFPNKEVEDGLLYSLLPTYVPDMTSLNGTDIFSLEKYVETGDLEEMKNFFTALFANIAYVPGGKNPFEHYFQTVLYLVFILLGKIIHTEIQMATGRIDAVVETEHFIYLFEFKRDDTAENALKQIAAKDYALKYAADTRKLYKIGVAFDSDTKLLSGWQVSE